MKKILFVLFCLLFLKINTLFAAVSFHPLNGTHLNSSEAPFISPNGMFITLRSHSGALSKAYIITDLHNINYTYKFLKPLNDGTPFSSPMAVSDNGFVAGYDMNKYGIISPTVWDPSNTVHEIINSTNPGIFSRANGISRDGRLAVGFYNFNSENVGFAWENNKIKILPNLMNISGNKINKNIGANDISGNKIVGWANNEIGTFATVWEDYNPTPIGSLSKKYIGSYANAISKDSSTIVGTSINNQNNEEAFYWNKDIGMIGLGTLGGNFSTAIDVSHDGKIIIGMSNDKNGVSLPFIWTEKNGMISLKDFLNNNYVNIESWKLLGINSISDDGNMITGTGSNKFGNREAFLIRIPSPGSFMIFLIGIFVFLIKR